MLFLLSYNLDQSYVRHEGIWVREGIAPLILVLNTIYRSAARFLPCPLRLLKESPGRDLKGSWVGSKIGLDHLERGKKPHCTFQESNHGFSLAEHAS
jgi:hypothetical protein